MATTTPDGIYYPTSTTQIAPLETQFSTLATSVQTALTNRKTITVANASALDALSESTYSGYVATVSGTGSQWYSNGTKWLLANIPNVANAAGRDALYSGSVTVTQGDAVWRNDLGYIETYYAAYNSSTNPGGKGTAGWYGTDGIVPSFPTVAARTSAITTLVQGMRSYIQDSNTYWTYYELYNASTNPGGASVAGWYPAEGSVLFAGKRNNTGQSIPTATATTVTFNTFTCAGSTTNNDTIQINSATVPSTFTVKKAGWYQLSYNIIANAWSSSAGSARAINVNRNSTASSTNMLMYQSEGTAVGAIMTETSNVLLAAGDVLRVWVYQDSGSSITNSATDFAITFLRPASV